MQILLLLFQLLSHCDALCRYATQQQQLHHQQQQHQHEKQQQQRSAPVGRVLVWMLLWVLHHGARDREALGILAWKESCIFSYCNTQVYYISI